MLTRRTTIRLLGNGATKNYIFFTQLNCIPAASTSVFWLIILLIAPLFLHGDELKTVCKFKKNKDIECTTKKYEITSEYLPEQINKPFSHIFVLHGQEVSLTPRIQPLNCDEMKKNVFRDMMQHNKESAIYSYISCVTVIGSLYPQESLSGKNLTFAFDLNHTYNQGKEETFLAIEKNPGWLRCRKTERDRVLEGHSYGCYKTRQQFSELKENSP